MCTHHQLSPCRSPCIPKYQRPSSSLHTFHRICRNTCGFFLKLALYSLFTLFVFNLNFAGMASHLILKRFFLKVSQLLQFFLCVCWHLREFSASLVFPIEASFKDDFCELSSRLVSYLHFLN
ncbi:hypothetical protein ACS0TY_016264 [Phlomoides rotata]